MGTGRVSESVLVRSTAQRDSFGGPCFAGNQPIARVGSKLAGATVEYSLSQSRFNLVRKLLRELVWAVYAMFAACLILGTACKSPLVPARLFARSPIQRPLTQWATIKPQAPIPESSVASAAVPQATGTLVPNSPMVKSTQANSPRTNSLMANSPMVAEETVLSSQSQSIATELDLPAIPFALETETKPTTSLVSKSSEPTSSSSSELEGTILPSEPEVRLVIAGVRAQRGSVKVAIFTIEDAFPNPSRASRTFELAATQATMETRLPMSGCFAIGVYQDLNADGELNRNRLGIPTEPFAFSNNAMGQRGPPSFEQAAVVADGDTPLTVTINLP